MTEFTELTQEYQRLADDVQYRRNHQDEDGMMLTGITLSATPEQIREFYDQVQSKGLPNPSGGDEYGPNALASMFVDMLIRNSYRAQQNGFEINGPAKDLLYMIRGDPANKLRVIIRGDLSDSLYCAEFIDLTVTGDVRGDFAYKAKGVQVKIAGTLDLNNSGDEPFVDALDSTFVLNTLRNVPRALYSVEHGPSNCIFKTGNENTLDFLLERMPFGNVIIRIKTDGTEMIKQGIDDHSRRN